MRAANSADESESSGDKRSYEPSMEEILASIRRIIADDQSLPNRAASAAAPAAHSAEVDTAPSQNPAPVAEAPIINRQAGDASLKHASSLADARSVEIDVARFEADAESEWASRGPAPDVAPPLKPEPPRAPAAPSAFAREPAYAERTPVVADAAADATDKAPIFSAETDAAVGAAFNMLAASRLASSSDEVMSLAREMIRPLLRSWIDDNLPSMVERLVRAEIERVARGGR